MKHPKRRPRKREEALRPKDLFGQPPANFYRLPELELRGGYILTDGCRKILDFTPERLCLDMGSVVITFYGQQLRIESLAGKRLAVAGRLRRLEFSDKWEEAPHDSENKI